MLKTISSIVNAIGALNYKGTWDASTNTPTLASGVGTKGDYYVVSVAGSTNLDGETLWGVGDWAVFNGSIWQKVDGGSTGNFTSVNTGTLGVTGNTTLGDATTDTVTVNGYMGVGGAVNAQYGVIVSSAALSGTSQIGAGFFPVATSAATSAVRGISVTPATAAASFTVGEATGALFANVSKGAGSTITSQRAIYILDQTNGTNNYGIESQVSSGANKYNIYASGTAQNYFAGNVGIGTAFPGARLDITSSAAFTARFSGPANTYIEVTDGTGTFRAQLLSNSPFLTSVGAYPLTFGTNYTERMRVDTSGNVGLGTASPANRLDIVNSASSAQMSIAGSDGQFAGMFGGTGSAGPGIFFLNTAPALRFGTGTAKSLGTFTELMRLTASGNLGLGVTPSAWGATQKAIQVSTVGSVACDSATVRLVNNAYFDGTNWVYLTTATASRYQQTSGIHSWFTAPSGTAGNAISFTQAMTLTASGSLGVGTTSPNGIIHAEVASGNAVIRSKTGGSGSPILILETTGIGAQQINANTGSVQNLTMTVAGSERLRIDASGNVGIGTTSPVNKLQVVGSFGRGAPVTKTGNFTLADTENWIICNGTGTITVTLPAASSWTGREFTIKTIAAFTVISNASNVVPLAGGAAGTDILAATAGTWATLVSDGTNWIIMQA